MISYLQKSSAAGLFDGRIKNIIFKNHPKNRTMKQLTLLLSIALLAIADTPTYAGKCSGDKYCTACKNCKYCKNCSQNGGTCGVCRPSKSKRVVKNKPVKSASVYRAS
ncbi:hypothetical protein DN068_12305 [Taibaiella soli]|uniref:Uncharacterized protein n=1 Tax=Taibaiella soli TaxID=1649169 RepID=A0A2W2ABF4_9BACT|nr:hypothetical protein DN068_12305 [Taibaiella soli]